MKLLIYNNIDEMQKEDQVAIPGLRLFVNDEMQLMTTC